MSDTANPDSETTGGLVTVTQHTLYDERFACSVILDGRKPAGLSAWLLPSSNVVLGIKESVKQMNPCKMSLQVFST